MSPEYSLIFLVLLLAVGAGFVSHRSAVTKSVYAMAAILMVACAGLRGGTVGRDYVVYWGYFSMSPDVVGVGFLEKWLHTMPNVDIAFVYFVSLIKAVGFPFEMLIFLTALIVVTLYAIFYWKHARFSAVALMLYYSHAFFYREMIQIRAGLACVLILWAYHFWAADRKRRGGALIVLAAMTHMAAAIAIVPALLTQFRLRPKPQYVLLSLMIAVAIGFNLNQSFPLFSQLNRLSAYQDTEYSEAIGIFSNFTTIKQMIILGLSCWLMNSGDEKFFSPVFRLCVNSYWISTLWIISFSQFEILGARGASFLSIGEPFVVAELVAKIYHESSLRRYRHAASFAVVGFALMILILNMKIKMVVNEYTTIFQ